MSIIAVIPARKASTRFPNKALALILGQPMILRVCEALKNCKFLDQIIVATDDEEIYQVVEKAGYQAQMTSLEHQSGTDRIWEVISKMQTPPDCVINVQGDEPLIMPQHIDSLVQLYQKYKSLKPFWGTLSQSFESLEDFESFDSVKVVKDRQGKALYFSRYPIPMSRQKIMEFPSKKAYKHVGVYAYSFEALQDFQKTAPGFLEKSESLEQLRALEMGVPIYVHQIQDQLHGVDRVEDIVKVESILNKRADTHSVK